MTDWRTIDSAPKDGREIPCLTNEYEGPVMLRFREGFWRDWDGDIYINVTHWFDLPAPPQ